MPVTNAHGVSRPVAIILGRSLGLVFTRGIEAGGLAENLRSANSRLIRATKSLAVKEMLANSYRSLHNLILSCSCEAIAS